MEAINEMNISWIGAFFGDIFYRRVGWWPAVKRSFYFEALPGAYVISFGFLMAFINRRRAT